MRQGNTEALSMKNIYKINGNNSNHESELETTCLEDWLIFVKMMCVQSAHSVYSKQCVARLLIPLEIDPHATAS